MTTLAHAPFPKNTVIDGVCYELHYLAGQHGREEQGAYLMVEGLPLGTINVSRFGQLGANSDAKSRVMIQSLKQTNGRYSIRALSAHGMFSGRAEEAGEPEFYQEQLSHTFDPQRDFEGATIEFYDHYGVPHATVETTRFHADGQERVTFLLWDKLLIIAAMKHIMANSARPYHTMNEDTFPSRSLSSLVAQAHQWEHNTLLGALRAMV